MDNVDIILGAN
jgi:hypothetical protein